jgi:hypothetical protein
VSHTDKKREREIAKKKDKKREKKQKLSASNFDGQSVQQQTN